MIRSLTGLVLDVLGNTLILDVNGIGFEVICSRSALGACSVGENIRIITSFQFSEVGAVIYGFASERERELFTRLTAVKGVGGRTAVAILSELSLDAVVEAVMSADVAAFARVPGIGKKTAERLCFELKNIASLRTTDSDTQPPAKTDSAANVMDALLSLGFSRADAGGVINLLRAAHGEDFGKLSEEDMLRLALRELHKS